MKKYKNITLQDIAQKAGCSVAAASRALSNDVLQNRLVAADTRTRVLLAAKTLGWVPRMQQQKKGSLGVVGVFIPHSNSVMTLDLLEAINNVARKSNTPVYCYGSANADSFRQFWNNHGSSSRTIGCVSYFPSDETDVPAFMEMYERFQKRDAPLVIMHNNAPEDFPAVSVKFDNFYGGRLAGKHLAELQCDHYLLLGFSIPYRHVRLCGCCEELNRYHMNYSVIVRKDIRRNVRETLPQIEQMVNWHDDSVTGILVDGAYDALTLHNYFLSKGVRIGQKLKLISYDDSPALTCATPAITAIRQPFNILGAKAMEKLSNMLRGFPEKSEYIQPELVIRPSTVSDI